VGITEDDSQNSRNTVGGKGAKNLVAGREKGLRWERKGSVIRGQKVEHNHNGLIGIEEKRSSGERGKKTILHSFERETRHKDGEVLPKTS